MLTRWQQNSIIIVLAILVGFVGALWLKTPKLCIEEDAQAQASKACRDAHELEKPTTITYWERTVDDPVALYTAILALFTVIMGIGTLGLVFVTAKQASDNQEAVKASVRSAKAARRSARTAESALTDLERPWVFQGELVLKSRSRTDVKFNNWWVAVQWRNVGRAPARLDRIEYRFQNIETLPPKPDYSDFNIIGVPDVLPHGDKFECQPRGLGTPETKPDGNPVEYVFYGRLIYREMNGREHQSGFAYMLAPYGNMALVYANDAYNYYT
jgi:hypothetical protein